MTGLTEPEYKLIPHPDLEGHLLAKNGQIMNKYGRLVGNYYGFVYKTVYYTSAELLFLTYGTQKRTGEYISLALRKRSIRKIARDDSKINKMTWKEQKGRTINLWYQTSGATSDFRDYFIENFNMTIDQMIEKGIKYLRCDSCILILEYDNLIISWGGIVTQEYLSLTLFKYLYKRLTTDNEHFSARYRLYPEEYKTFGQIIQGLFRDNLASDYGDGLGVGEIPVEKIKKEKPDFLPSLNYDDFSTDDDNDFGCAEFVLSNIDLTIRDNGKRKELPEISRENFNKQFRKLIEMNKGEYPLSHMFVEYSPYFFEEMWHGFRRLDNDLQNLILKEL